MRSFYRSGREVPVRYNQKNKIVQTGADWHGISWDKWHYKEADLARAIFRI
jgi:hypothetical protein